jgi:hypothetical protein
MVQPLNPGNIIDDSSLGSNLHEDEKSDSSDLEDLDQIDLSEYSAKTISIGAYHAVALLGEKDIHDDFNPISALQEGDGEENDYFSSSRLLDQIRGEVKAYGHKGFEWNK